jgi:hypothetical protein
MGKGEGWQGDMQGGRQTGGLSGRGPGQGTPLDIVTWACVPHVPGQEMPTPAVMVTWSHLVRRG